MARGLCRRGQYLVARARRQYRPRAAPSGRRTRTLEAARQPRFCAADGARSVVLGRSPGRGTFFVVAGLWPRGYPGVDGRSWPGRGARDRRSGARCRQTDRAAHHPGGARSGGAGQQQLGPRRQPHRFGQGFAGGRPTPGIAATERVVSGLAAVPHLRGGGHEPARHPRGDHRPRQKHRLVVHQPAARRSGHLFRGTRPHR